MHTCMYVHYSLNFDTVVIQSFKSYPLHKLHPRMWHWIFLLCMNQFCCSLLCFLIEQTIP